MDEPRTDDTPSVDASSLHAAEPQQLPLFVYGTLKPGEPNYRAYLAGRTLAEYSAMLRSAALFTDGIYPFLVVEPALVDPLDHVRGTLVVLAPEHYVETLRRIDWLEDYKPYSPWSLYERITTVVEIPDGAAEAWTYAAGARVLASIRAGRLRKLPGGKWSASGTS